jgi:serine/threonine-protein kinase
VTVHDTDPRYRLDSRIATGGMGEVWRATDTVLDRRVAVKVLKPEYADDPTFRSRFEAEARHAAALHHHNVASVFDFGELEPDDGSDSPRPYLVMELVPGRPLSTLLREEAMPPETAAELVAQAADAVASAHALGIVHRDVKPGNLLVTPRGQVKITDFGIARAADGAALTQTGQVIGTPAYLSPEQAEGKPATPASDVYSLGVVLYECLAGARPFNGDTPVSTALAHLRDDPPPLPGHVPEHLREVVAVALAKDPQRRFTSMAAFASALRGGPIAAPAAASAAAVHPEPPVAEPIPLETDPVDGTRVLTGPVPLAPERRRRRGRPAWLPWAAAALGVLLVVVVVSAVFGDQEPTGATADGPAAAAAGGDEQPTRDEPATFRIDEGDFLGMPKDEARAQLEERGLRVKDEKVDNPDGLAPDTVAGVSPTRGLREGDQVVLQVWGAPPAEDDGDDDEDDEWGKPGKHAGKGKAKGHEDKDD